MKPDKPANSFSADLAGLPPVSSDTLAAAVASAAAAVGCGAQVVPHMPASNLTPTPTAQPGHLTPDALAELELARQRAARAAAGRRQQLIAQKRAKEQAHQEALAAAADKRRRTASAPAPASAMTMQSSGDDSDADEGQMASTGDPIKDSRRLKRLLRNRVSAQQARERKKQHMNDLEEQVCLRSSPTASPTLHKSPCTVASRAQIWIAVSPLSHHHHLSPLSHHHHLSPPLCHHHHAVPVSRCLPATPAASIRLLTTHIFQGCWMLLASCE
ncbi:hypothetical protein V8C86DRAFT_2531424 [Haematococcus lacustris]